MRWLSDVALHRYEHFNGAGSDPGLAKGMRFENGDLIDVEAIISNKLKAEEHVWVILNEDLALMEAERKKEYWLELIWLNVLFVKTKFTREPLQGPQQLSVLKKLNQLLEHAL